MTARVPITVIAGYLGAGKTTLLNRVLTHAADLKGVAIVVNDFGDVNIDADLIQDQTPDGEVIALTNGCVCCSVQDDFTAGLERLKAQPLKQVLLEASGVAVPAKLRHQCAYPGYHQHLCVVVVDATAHHRQCQDKYVGSLVRQQVAEADVLAISKWDAAPDFAPNVTATPCYDAADPRLVALLLDVNDSPIAADDAASHSGPDQDNPPRFYTCTLHQQAELTDEDLQRLMDALPATVIRAKGFAHVAGETRLVQKAGSTTTCEPYPAPQPGRLVVISTAPIAPDAFDRWPHWRVG